MDQALLRFDGIIGPGAGQIPEGATIVSATLTLRVGAAPNDPTVSPVHFHRLLNTWVDTDVFAAYGDPPWNATDGIQADGVDAMATAEATATMGLASTAYPVDRHRECPGLGERLRRATMDGRSSRRGPDGRAAGESSDSATPSYRPLLSVTYTPAITNPGAGRADEPRPRPTTRPACPVNPTLSVTVSDPEAEPLDVTFYGRHVGEDFTIVHVSDSQFYTQSNPTAFETMMDWVNDNQAGSQHRPPDP